MQSIGIYDGHEKTSCSINVSKVIQYVSISVSIMVCMITAARLDVITLVFLSVKHQ